MAIPANSTEVAEYVVDLDVHLRQHLLHPLNGSACLGDEAAAMSPQGSVRLGSHRWVESCY
jgi:hypothetical protein